MSPTKLIETLRENGWNYCPYGELDPKTGKGFAAEDISGLWRVSVLADRVMLMGPLVHPHGFPIAQFIDVERRNVGPFGWATTVAAVLNSHGFTTSVTNPRYMRART